MANFYKNDPTHTAYLDSIATGSDIPGMDDEGVFDPGFWGSFSKPYQISFLETEGGRDWARQGMINEQEELLSAILNEDVGINEGSISSWSISNPMGIGMDKSPEELLAERTEQIKELQKEYPYLMTIDEIEQQIADDYQKLNKDNNIDAENRDWVSKISAGIGYAAGWLSDPINAATIALSPAAGAGALGTMAKTASREMAAYLGTQAKDKPGEVEMRERGGEEVTAADIALEVGLETAFTGLVTGAFSGLLHKAIKGDYNAKRLAAEIEKASDSWLNKIGKEKAVLDDAVSNAQRIVPSNPKSYLLKAKASFDDFINNRPVQVMVNETPSYVPLRAAAQNIPTTSFQPVAEMTRHAAPVVDGQLGRFSINISPDVAEVGLSNKSGVEVASIYGAVTPDRGIAVRNILSRSPEESVELLKKMSAEARARGFSYVDVPKTPKSLYKAAKSLPNAVGQPDKVRLELGELRRPVEIKAPKHEMFAHQEARELSSVTINTPAHPNAVDVRASYSDALDTTGQRRVFDSPSKSHVPDEASQATYLEDTYSSQLDDIGLEMVDDLGNTTVRSAKEVLRELDSEVNLLDFVKACAKNRGG